ncbi:hypothetical protein Q7A53_05105 [Halobacillus rhizosphaerae]|uniref:guanylate kinase n=1 Tax=Halobacillus rhizosphaerae TaxID=3064889 RepID=UPI00398AABB7
MGIVLITAPSGSGKTYLMNLLKRNYNAKVTKFIGECISHTTRKIRENETDGVTYYYVDEATFDKMRENDEFAESVVYDGKLYGITKKEIKRVLSQNYNVYIIVNYDGYKQVSNAFPDSIGIFLHMDKKDCLANMLLRGDTIDDALSRISTYEEEMKNRTDYDYVVKNIRDKENETIKIIHSIIEQNQ